MPASLASFHGLIIPACGHNIKFSGVFTPFSSIILIFSGQNEGHDREEESSLLTLFIRALLLYIALVAFTRAMGKRQMGQLHSS